MDGSDAGRTRALTVPITLNGQPFKFRLHTRPLDLGPGVRVQYYWMDSSLFRLIKSEPSCAAVQAVVGHWAAAMAGGGVWDEPDQRFHHVAAVCYSLVASAKSQQDVYRDAYLAPGSTDPTADSLPDDTQRRIRRVVRARDDGLVRAELDLVLGRFEPPGRLMPLLQEACRRWLETGAVAFHRAGDNGLLLFLRVIKSYLALYRKKGGNEWVRKFANLFSYHCKVSFYNCYANAWVSLIPWLREHRALDKVSERFLGFWHNQNTSSEGPDGRDVFNGQVLALHPLSGFFMKDPALLAVAGRFFGTAAYDRAITQGKRGSSRAYWELIGAILTAAHLYRNALDRQQGARQTRTVGVPNPSALPAEGGADDELAMLREFLSKRGLLTCPRCGAEADLRSADAVGEAAKAFDVHLTCRACRRPVTHSVPTDDLFRWLRSGA